MLEQYTFDGVTYNVAADRLDDFLAKYPDAVKADKPGKTSGAAMGDAVAASTDTELASDDGSLVPQEETSWGTSIAQAFVPIAEQLGIAAEDFGDLTGTELKSTSQIQAEQEKVRKSNETWKSQQADLMGQLDVAFDGNETLFGENIFKKAVELEIGYETDASQEDPTKTGVTDLVRDLVKEQIGGFGWFSDKTDFGETRYGMLTDSDVNDIIDQKIGELKTNYEESRRDDRVINEAGNIVAGGGNIESWKDQTDEQYRASYEGLNAEIAESVRLLTETDLQGEAWDAERDKLLNLRKQKGLADENMLFNLRTGQFVVARDAKQKESMLQSGGFTEASNQNAVDELAQILGEAENPREALANEFYARALTYNNFKQETSQNIKVGFMSNRPGGDLVPYELPMEEISINDLLRREELVAGGIFNPIELLSSKGLGTAFGIGKRAQQVFSYGRMGSLAPKFLDAETMVYKIELPDGTVITDPEKIGEYVNNYQADDFAFNSEYKAAADMYYLNEGLADIEKPAFGGIKATAKSLVAPWADDYYADQIYGSTSRDKIDAAAEVYDQLGIETTKAEEQAKSTTLGELVNTGLAGSNKMLYEFRAMNKLLGAAGVEQAVARVTGGLKTGHYVSSTGKVYSNANMAARAKAAGYGDDVAAYAEKALGGRVVMAPTLADRGVNILSAGLYEGGKFSAFEYYDFAENRFKGEDEKSPYSFWTGFGFGAAGRLLTPLAPYLSKKFDKTKLGKAVEDFRVLGKDFGINSRKLIENFVTQPASFVAGSEFGEIMNNLVSDAMGDGDFSKFLGEHYGHLDEVGKRLVSQYFIGLGFGLTHSNSFNDIKSAEAIRRTKNKQFDHLIDEYGTLAKLTKEEMNNFFSEETQNKITNNLSPENLGKYKTQYDIFKDLNIRYHRAMMAKNYLNPATADKMVREDHKDLIESEAEAGRKVEFEVVNNDNLKFGQKPISDTRNAEIVKKEGVTTIRYNAKRYAPGLMAHEVHHHFTEEILGSDAVFKAEFMQNLDKIGSTVKLNRRLTEQDVKELGLEQGKVGQKMNLSESIKLMYGDFTSPKGLRKAQWEIFAHIAEEMGKKTNYLDIIESAGFSTMKDLISPLGKRTGKKLNLSRQQDVVEWFARYAENVGKGKTPVELFEQLKEVIDPELTKLTKEKRLELEKESETMASEDLEAIGQTEADNARIKEELDTYYKNNLSGKENITIEDIKELQGQKKRGDSYDIDIDSPYTDFEKYPVLGNVLGRVFDQAARLYQRNIGERYRVNLNDRSYGGERTELALEVLSNEKRGLLDIVRRYDPNKGTFKSWLTGQLALRMQELKAVSVDAKYESRRAEAEGEVVSGTDISDLTIDLTEINKGGGIDKSSDKLGVSEEPIGIKLREHQFEFEGGIKKTINPESIRRIEEAGEVVFNETPAEELTFMGVATRMREVAMPEMDLLFRNEKQVEKPKDIEVEEKKFTENVNNSAMLYDAMPKFSHSEHYENTFWGRTIYAPFYRNTGVKFKSADLPVELTKSSNARTFKHEKLPLTPERLREFIDVTNAGRDAGTRNKKRATLKQGVGDVFVVQTFREMLQKPEFRQRAESTPEGKAKLKALDAELAIRKLRGATPEKLASEDVDILRDFENKIKTYDFAKEPAAGFFIRNEIENNAELRRVIEKATTVEEFLKDSTYDLKDVDIEVFREYNEAAKELDQLTYKKPFTPETFAGGYSGSKNNRGVDQAIVEAVSGVRGGKEIVKLLNVLDSAVGKLRGEEGKKFSEDHYDVFVPEFFNTFDPRILTTLEGILGKTAGEGQVKPSHEPKVASHRSDSNRLNAQWRSDTFGKLQGKAGRLPKGLNPKHVKVNDNKTVKEQVDKILEQNPGATPEKLAKLIKKKLSWNGTVEGYAQTVKANELMLEYTAGKIFDYIKSAKGPVNKARAINHITHMLQSQTSIGGGLFRGLATHEAISIKKGKTHSEHDFQLGNFTGNILLDAIKNSGNKAEFNKNVKSLVQIYKQSIIDKNLQEQFDSAEYGGKSNFDFLYTTDVGKYMWMREADVARTTVELSSEKTYDQLLGDVIGGNRALQKAKALGKKALMRDGLASESMDMSLDDINMAIKIREAALRNGRLKNKTKRGMSTFDFDETLIIKGENFVTAKKGSDVIRISSEEFPVKGPELAADGYKFDFKDFVNVKGGVEGPLFTKLKNQIAKYGNENVFVLTARMQDAAPAIHQWLKSKGVDLPIENITGLGNSTGEAKALWMLEKFARGYNDMYFVDDALSNVKAVKKVLDQLDIKSNVQQALASENLDIEVNNIMEQVFKIDANKRFSKAEGRMRGKDKKRRKLFLPDSASDLELLLEPLYGKGSQGVKNKQWFSENFYKKFERGINDYNTAKQRLTTEYMSLRKNNKQTVKDLGKEVPGTNFTNDMAMRVYIWNKAGFTIPDLAATTQKKLVDHIQSNSAYKRYADSVARMTGIETGLKEPTAEWWSETLATEISDANRGVGRKEYLSDFIEARQEIFSEANLNKMEAELGKDWRDNIEDMFDRMETGRTRSERLTGITGDLINYFNGSIGAIMNFNTRSAVLQLISTANFVNMSFNNPARAAQAFANQPQYWKDFMKIMNSDMLKQRRGGLEINVTEAEIAAAAKESKNPAKAVMARIMKAGYIPTKYADSFAIAAGGATYYRNSIRKYMKEGISKAEAEKKAFIDFQAIAERTQQSSRPDLISREQTTLAGRLILPFANTPLQMNRLAMREMLDVYKGRYKGTGELTTKLGKIGYYGFVQTLFFAGLQSAAFAIFANSDDDETKAKKQGQMIDTVVDSGLRGMGIKGAILNGVVNAAKELETQAGKDYGADYSEVAEDLLNISPPIGSKFRKLDAAGNTYKYNKEQIDEEGIEFSLDSPGLQAATQVTEAVTNLPANRIFKKANNVKNAMSDEYEPWQRFLMFLGWSNWDVAPQQAKEQAKSKKKKKKEQDKKDKTDRQTFIVE